MEPKRPLNLPEMASLCLRALAKAGMGHCISLGGALGLLHYLDYRSTHDVDAWWDPVATPEQRNRLIEVLETALAAHGEVRRRSWGDVVSIDLKAGDRTVFNFQIANRSALLEPPGVAPWVDVHLDSLPDLIAGKMVALVERGAPRDFRDIHAACQAELTTPGECWSLWRRRQEGAASDTDRHRARLAVETHLERIAKHRPLDEIKNIDQRAEADAVRTWFRTEFLDAVSD
jgi:hypothetical protein